MEPGETTKKEIAGIVRKINRSWLDKNYKNLESLFHEDMIIASQNLVILATGKEQCIKSYLDFREQSGILKYSESEPDIHVWESTAIASYSYNIAWEMRGESFTESGKDLFIFARDNKQWTAVWRLPLFEDG